MTQTIKIKRSTTTAVPSSLQNGELAYSEDSKKLFIGRPGGTTGDVDAIGGKFYTNLVDTNSDNWTTAYNNQVTSVTFDSDGVLSLNQQDGGALTVDLDGRYLQSYSETDTLDSVTDRGASTTNSITVGGLTVSGDLTVSGTTTSVNTEEVNIADNFVLLNSNFSGAASENAGIEINRGSDANVQIRYNETDDAWELTNDGSTYNAIATGASVRTDQEIIDLSTGGTQTNISVTDGGTGVDFAVPTATASVLGVASFASPDFSVSAGAVSLNQVDGGTF